MTNFKITEQDFNQLSEVELNKVLISFNDGQGDNCVYNWTDIIDISGDDIEGKTNIEILDMFYDSNDLTGNSSNMVYFDGEMKNLLFI